MVSQAIPESGSASCPVNLSTNERMVSAVAGGALFLFGLNRLSVPAVVLTTVGGLLLFRGLGGYCPFTADRSAGRLGENERRFEKQPESASRRAANPKN